MKKEVKNQISLQASLMSLGTLLSRILGFLRDLTLASFFSKTETDIFFVAFRFPNFFRRLLGEGTFSASVTPALTEHLEKQDWESTKKLHSAIFTILFFFTVLLTILGVLFMPWIINSLFENSEYARIEGKIEKTIIVGRVVFTYLFFVSLYSYLMSVAQVFGKFFIPALAPAFFNVSLISFAWMPQNLWPFPSMALAWAVIAGAILQLIPVLYEIHKLNFLPSFTFKKNPTLLKVGKRFLPGMIGLSGLSCVGLINVYFAGWLEEGANSYIYYGDRLLEFPRALIAVSLGTALVPALTRQYSTGSLTELKQTLTHYLRILLFLTLPCALVFFLQSETIVELLFGYGKFDQESVKQTAMILKFYTLVLIFSSLSRILCSCFFAINKNWFMVIATFCFVLFHFLASWYLTPIYALKGLVAATALSSVFFFIALSFCLVYLIGSLNFKFLIDLMLNIAPGLLALALSLLVVPNVFYKLHCFLLEDLCTNLPNTFNQKFVSQTLVSYLNPIDLSYISNQPLISIAVFGFSCTLGGILYLSLSQACKEPVTKELMKLLKRGS